MPVYRREGKYFSDPYLMLSISFIEEATPFREISSLITVITMITRTFGNYDFDTGTLSKNSKTYSGIICDKKVIFVAIYRRLFILGFPLAGKSVNCKTLS